MKRIPMTMWTQRALEEAGRLEMVVWPKLVLSPWTFPMVKLIGRMIVMQITVMMKTKTIMCLWNLKKKLRKMIVAGETDLMYWMASMPHFLRIMSSERVKILVTQEHIPRSTSENSPPTIESVSFSAEATNPPEENSF